MAEKKVWFITGCSSGFGRAIALQALLGGDKVVVTARDINSIADFTKEHGENVLTLPLDVTIPEQITLSIAKTKQTFGRIDVLVNNAGYGVLGAVEEVPEMEVRRLFEANFFGLLNVTRAILPIMRAQKSGHIINMSSAGGLVSVCGFGIYNATKFALEGLSEALAQEVEPLGIKVTLIEPGPFRTHFADQSLIKFQTISDYDTTRGVFNNMVEQYHDKQPGDPEKAAKVIVDLANNPVPPLRLPMGKLAVERIREKMSELTETLATWEKVSIDTDYEK